MTDETRLVRGVVNKDSLPDMYPTDQHSPEFWEHLGRAVATCAFLEEVLGKAIFALTGTRRYDNTDEAEAAYAKWLPTLERALYDPLGPLIDAYAKAARENPDFTTGNLDELLEHLREAAELRNVLCHGSWRAPDPEGKSLPLFVTRKKLVFDTPIDVAYLKRVQRAVAELACEVVSTITHMGWQFPGGGGPGKPVW